MDEDDDIRYVIRHMLEMGKLEVTEIANGKGAYKAVRLFISDLILLDVMLGDCDGLDI